MPKYPFALAALALLLSNGFKSLQAQDLKYGLRAGVNVGTIFGPKASDADGKILENNRTTVKLAFGASIRYPITPKIGLIGEVNFVQRGSNYSFEGKSFLKLPDYENQGSLFFEGHDKTIIINNTNSYLEIPALFYATIIPDRLQVEFGPSVGILLISRGLGTTKYRDSRHPAEIVEMDMNYNYLRDQAGATADIPNGFGGSFPSGKRTGRIDGTTITFPQSIGAYYFEDRKDGNKFHSLDFGLNAGLAFFFTQGVRVGARAYYGLLDVTNSRYDYDQQKLGANRAYIERNDKDVNFGVQIYLGLQFN